MRNTILQPLVFDQSINVINSFMEDSRNLPLADALLKLRAQMYTKSNVIFTVTSDVADQLGTKLPVRHQDIVAALQASL